MNECLVTKLKSSVNDDGLKFLGGIIFDVNIPIGYTYDSSSYIRFDAETSDKSFTLKILGNGYFRKGKTDSSSIGKEIVVSGPIEIVPSEGNYKIVAFGKYDVETVIIGLDFSEGLAYIEDLDDLSYSDKITVFNTWKGSIGNLQTLGKCVNLSSFKINYSSIQGEIESLVESLWKNGFEVGSRVSFSTNNKITLNGKAFNNGYSGNITRESGRFVITRDSDNTEIASYNGVSWVYNF